MSWMAWEICLIVQVGWAAMRPRPTGSPPGCTRSSGCPAKVINSSQYSVLYAFQAGISIVIGGYAIGWLADKIGRRKALIISAALAGAVHLAVRVRDELSGAVRLVDRRHASGSPGSWPSTSCT